MIATADAIAERTELMSKLLAEVDPLARFEVIKAEESTTGMGVICPSPWTDASQTKAAHLSAMRMFGPGHPVVCGLHAYVGGHHRCEPIPVAWVLLGHTCGRAS